jgi:enamine deaminase RidA (YjgF/YER057c/UK114 family)
MPGQVRSIVNTKSAPQPVQAYSQAVRVSGGSLLFVSGQVAADLNGAVVGVGDAAAQTKQALANIQAILASQGAEMTDVVEFTTYVVGRESVAGYMAGRSEVFPDMYPDGDFPANTVLVISGLAREDFLVEISAVAALR